MNDKESTPPNNENDNDFISTTLSQLLNIAASSKATATELIDLSRKKRYLREKERELKELAPMSKSAPGKIFGPILLILGLFILACSLGYFAAFYFIFKGSLLTITLILLIPLLLSVFFIIAALKLNKQVQVYQTFKSIFKQKPYIEVSELAKKANLSEKKTTKYLNLFLEEGLYPKAKFAHNNTYFVLSPRALQLLNEELKEQKIEKEEADNLNELNNKYPKLYRVVSEINSTSDYINKLRREKRALQKPQLEKELNRMEYLLDKIQTFIINNPKQVPDIRGFMDYFLPTVKKLLSTYCKLDKEQLQTSNITESKSQIESSLNSINDAFENMYNDFYSETAIDIYSDITVLKSMIHTKGFSDSDF